MRKHAATVITDISPMQAWRAKCLLNKAEIKNRKAINWYHIIWTFICLVWQITTDKWGSVNWDCANMNSQSSADIPILVQSSLCKYSFLSLNSLLLLKVLPHHFGCGTFQEKCTMKLKVWWYVMPASAKHGKHQVIFGMKDIHIQSWYTCIIFFGRKIFQGVNYVEFNILLRITVAVYRFSMA